MVEQEVLVARIRLDPVSRLLQFDRRDGEESSTSAFADFGVKQPPRVVCRVVGVVSMTQLLKECQKRQKIHTQKWQICVNPTFRKWRFGTINPCCYKPPFTVYSFDFSLLRPKCLLPALLAWPMLVACLCVLRPWPPWPLGVCRFLVPSLAGCVVADCAWSAGMAMALVLYLARSTSFFFLFFQDNTCVNKIVVRVAKLPSGPQSFP